MLKNLVKDLKPSSTLSLEWYCSIIHSAEAVV